VTLFVNDIETELLRCSLVYLSFGMPATVVEIISEIDGLSFFNRLIQINSDFDNRSK
jgi:hypothetical protein